MRIDKYILVWLSIINRKDTMNIVHVIYFTILATPFFFLVVLPVVELVLTLVR